MSTPSELKIGLGARLGSPVEAQAMRSSRASGTSRGDMGGVNPSTSSGANAPMTPGDDVSSVPVDAAPDAPGNGTPATSEDVDAPTVPDDGDRSNDLER